MSLLIGTLLSVTAFEADSGHPWHHILVHNVFLSLFHYFMLSENHSRVCEFFLEIFTRQVLLATLPPLQSQFIIVEAGISEAVNGHKLLDSRCRKHRLNRTLCGLCPQVSFHAISPLFFCRSWQLRPQIVFFDLPCHLRLDTKIFVTSTLDWVQASSSTLVKVWSLGFATLEVHAVNGKGQSEVARLSYSLMDSIWFHAWSAMYLIFFLPTFIHLVTFHAGPIVCFRTLRNRTWDFWRICLGAVPRTALGIRFSLASRSLCLFHSAKFFQFTWLDSCQYIPGKIMQSMQLHGLSKSWFYNSINLKTCGRNAQLVFVTACLH